MPGTTPWAPISRGVVDDDLRAGHQEDVLVFGEVEERIAEVAVVAAGILAGR